MKNAPATPRQRPATCRGMLAAVVFSGGAMALSATAHAVDTAAAEGDTMTFAVKLGAAPNGWAVRYKYRTQDQSAHAGDDYESTSGIRSMPSTISLTGQIMDNDSATAAARAAAVGNY